MKYKDASTLTQKEKQLANPNMLVIVLGGVTVGAGKQFEESWSMLVKCSTAPSSSNGTDATRRCTSSPASRPTSPLSPSSSHRHVTRGQPGLVTHSAAQLAATRAAMNGVAVAAIRATFEADEVRTHARARAAARR